MTIEETTDQHADRDSTRVGRDLGDVAHVLHDARDDGDLHDRADEREQNAAADVAAHRDRDAPLPERDLDEHEGHDHEGFHCYRSGSAY